jgi:antitoxin component YwqK of YwqJK toxin-antitoxin module
MKFQQHGFLVTVLFLTGTFTMMGQNLLDEKGRKTGLWIEEYPSGKKLYEANFVEGKPVGEMIRYYESGVIRARMLFDTLLDRSYTSMFYENGRLAAEGLYVDKKKDSVWTYYSEFDGTMRISEQYKNGDLHGKVKRYYTDGTVSEEVSWKQNLRSGPWTQYFYGGVLRLSATYQDDMLEGLYEVYNANGNIQIRGTYRQDKSHGTWSFYTESGEEAYSIEYENGKAMDQEKYRQLMQDSLMKLEPLTEPELRQQ